MRSLVGPGALVMLLASALALGAGGCRKSLGMTGAKAARALGPLVWTAIPADDIAVLVSRPRHSTRFAIAVPPAPAEGTAGAVRQVEVRFARPLDSAKVNAFAAGPRHRVMLLEEKRVRGDALALAVPALTLDRIELEVHHHRRTPPLPPEVRIGREVRR